MMIRKGQQRRPFVKENQELFCASHILHNIDFDNPNMTQQIVQLGKHSNFHTSAASLLEAAPAASIQSYDTLFN